MTFPGSEWVQFDMEKLFLLAVSKENQVFKGNIRFVLAYSFPMFFFVDLSSTICRPKISPPKVIYKVQSMPYKSLPLGAFWTIFGRNFPTGVLQLLYPYQPANPLVESMFKALRFSFFCLIKIFEISLGDRS